MKNFQDVTAEVFKRSEQRKQKAKRRTKWIFSMVASAACVAVCVGVMLWSPWGNVSSDRFTDDGYDAVPESSVMSSVEQTDNGIAEYQYVLLEIIRSPIADSTQSQVTDSQKIQQIADSTQSPMTDSQKIQQIADKLNTLCEHKKDGFKDEADDTSSADRAIEYKIILRSSDGAETVYLLIGNMLYGQNVTSAVVLTDSELQELQELLGI